MASFLPVGRAMDLEQANAIEAELRAGVDLAFNEGVRVGRASQAARIVAVLEHDCSKGYERAALHFLLNTSMETGEIIQILAGIRLACTDRPQDQVTH